MHYAYDVLNSSYLNCLKLLE